MTAPFEALSDIDRLVHEPARLAILTVLDACRRADFPLLMSATGLPNGSVSSHLTKLEAAGLVEVIKSFRGRRPHTEASLTPAGRDRVRRHWQCLEDARKRADTWRALGPQPAEAS